jgi:hypothetical protein
MEPISFSKYKNLAKHCFKETGCNLYAGVGICLRPALNTAVLKSIDNINYYDDDLSDPDNPKYTLFGHNGDQDKNEKRFNEPLLNKNKTEHIYLYRKKINGKKKEYLWYGKYEIDTDGTETKLHKGEDGVMRQIIILSLKRVE